VPFLRVLRDKRGYETTYLMHWFRDGSRQRSRILYMFRTPPGVRVGCDVLDPAMVREIEAQHPDIEFDWRALFDNRQVVETSPEPRHSRGPKGGGTRPDQGDPRKRHREEPAQASRAPDPVEAPAPAPVVPAAPKPDVARERFQIPPALEGTTREEQLAFLAKWYPEIRDRIPHRTHDPIRRDALMLLTERLNAAPWATEEQIAAGLVHASEALHRLSRVFSKRRRRPRRPKPAEPEAGPTNESA
jgi:hypothetical protein